jgi:hypothetical protein
MALAFQRFKVYSKLAVVSVVSITLLVVVLKNVGNKANVWLYRDFNEVSTLWLMLVTSVTAIVTWWLLWGLRRLVVEWRQLRKVTAVEAKLAEQKALADEIAAREQRIDEKLKGSIANESELDA